MVSVEKNVCALSGQASGLRSAGQRLMLLADEDLAHIHMYIYIYICVCVYFTVNVLEYTLNPEPYTYIDTHILYCRCVRIYPKP